MVMLVIVVWPILRTPSRIGIYTSFAISAIMLLYDLNLSIGWIDAHLNRRYQRLVKQHMTPAAPLASALKDLACAQ
ncbi:hypothetical protein EXD76_02095, partial [BEV proteobacterium]|nr:hypothetical protein [Candidatus Symbiopectobacterium sp. Chty_BC]